MWFNANGGFKWYKSGALEMVLDTNGNLGIGTATPAYALHVLSGSSLGANDALLVTPNSGGLGRGSGILFDATFNNAWGGADTVVRYSGAIRYLPNETTAASRNHRLAFYTNDPPTPSDTPTERMSILSSGRVGIGTTAPSGQLHIVADSTFASGSFYGLYLTGAQSVADTGAFYGEYINPT